MEYFTAWTTATSFSGALCLKWWGEALRTENILKCLWKPQRLRPPQTPARRHLHTHLVLLLQPLANWLLLYCSRNHWIWNIFVDFFWILYLEDIKNQQSISECVGLDTHLHLKTGKSWNMSEMTPSQIYINSQAVSSVRSWIRYYHVPQGVSSHLKVVSSH